MKKFADRFAIAAWLQCQFTEFWCDRPWTVLSRTWARCVRRRYEFVRELDCCSLIFFFIWRVFGFQAVDCGLRHWDSFLRFFTGAPQRNRSKGCLNCRSGTPSYPHTALDPATGGMWSWRWICEVNLKRCLDLESLFSQLYVIIDCRQLIIMIVHHMYIIVYSIYSIIW